MRKVIRVREQRDKRRHEDDRKYLHDFWMSKDRNVMLTGEPIV